MFDGVEILEKARPALTGGTTVKEYAYGFTLESVGIGEGDLYRDENGDLKIKPNYCPHSEPEGLEDCWTCFWYDGSREICRRAEE